MATQPALSIQPLTSKRWDDLVGLFGPRGAYANCWCLWWRLPRKAFDRISPDAKKAQLHSLVAARRPLGLLAYAGRRAVGWCAVAPRADYGLLARSRLFPPSDWRPVWSLTCFFVAKDCRRQGVMRALLKGAIAQARHWHAPALEAYPVVTAVGQKTKVPELFPGPLGLYLEAGFVEIAAPSPRRRLVRLELA